MNAAPQPWNPMVVPWIVMGTYERANGSVDSVCEVIEAPRNRGPLAEDSLGAAGAVRVICASVYPATRLLEIDRASRPSFAMAWFTYHRWAQAKALGKRPDQLTEEDCSRIRMSSLYLAWVNEGGATQCR